jgi:ubiquinone/menaquinone biosynthesis C-methylase UbiE
MQQLQDFTEINRALWDEWAEIHFASPFYDVKSFKRGRSTLGQHEVAELGNVSGKTLLHLQCHFGLDTLSWARLGARVTGVDFSSRAIAIARSLSTDLAIPASFVESNVYNLPDVLHEQFDIVFASYGVLLWLSDLTSWGKIVCRYLKKGGIFFIIDAHPIIWVFDNEHPSELCVKHSYFHSSSPLTFDSPNYAAPSNGKTYLQYYWIHSVSDVINALTLQSLNIKYFREHATITWKAFPFLVKSPDGYFRLPTTMPQIPLTFSLKAQRE